MSIPYRQNALHHRCQECGDMAEGACPRCGAPLCPSHTPETGDLCANCEEEWEVRKLAACAMGRGAGASLYPLIYTALCAVLLMGLSFLMLTVITLPPWVPRSALGIALVVDLAMLIGLLSPWTQAMGQRLVLRALRRRFVADSA